MLWKKLGTNLNFSSRYHTKKWGNKDGKQELRKYLEEFGK